jgi:pimeloyl-ACP methyl ester carboxylesterase
MVRPSQIRASSKDATHMIPDAYSLSSRYGDLDCPIAVLSGDADKVVDFKEHALRFQATVPGSLLDIFPGAGHMIHHVDPERVVCAASAMTVTPTNARATGRKMAGPP